MSLGDTKGLIVSGATVGGSQTKTNSRKHLLPVPEQSSGVETLFPPVTRFGA
jgi:hypothetical protein